MNSRNSKPADNPNTLSRIFLSAVLLVFAALAHTATAEQPPQKLTLTALTSLERIGIDEHPTGPAAVHIYAARNEYESFQLVLTAPTQTLTITAVHPSDLIADDGSKISKENFTLFRPEYILVRRPTPRAQLPPGLYPDPLVPFINPLTSKPIEPRRQFRKTNRWGEPITTVGYEIYALPRELFKGQNLPIWVDLYIPKNARPGTYHATFTVRAAGGISARIPLTLTVWNFTLPDGPTLRNHFGNFRNITHYFNAPADSDRFRRIEQRFCAALARHRINPPIPRHLLPKINTNGSLTISSKQHQALAEFIARFHLTDFEIPRPSFASLPHSTLRPDYKSITPENRRKAIRYFRDFYAYLAKHQWQNRAYLYLWDEPNLRENYEQVLALGELVHQAVPQLQRLVVEQTYPQNPAWPDIDPAVDIWCPLWAFIDANSIRQKIAHGDEVWSYTALAQRAPSYHPQYKTVKDHDPPYWHIDQPLLAYRIPTWINYRYDITGLLYWTTLTKVLAPWYNPALSHYSKHFNGGGFLLYPGTPCGIDGPIPSIRLKVLRDAMEDYEYFILLEKLAGKRATKNLVSKIAPTWWAWAKDPRAILTAREQIARRIIEHTQRLRPSQNH